MSSSSMSRRDGGAYRRAGLTVALALAALAAFPAIASAASVTFTTANDTITYTGGAGETNSVVIDDSSSTSYTFTETGISESPNVSECSDGGDVITCTFSSSDDIDTIVANAGDMGDTVNAAGITTEDVQLNGEAGGDTITGGSQNDSGGTGLSGGDGSDTINGGAGDDEVNGGNDNDTLIGGSSTDDLNGDAGNDRLDGGNDSGDDGDDYDGGSGIDRVVYGSLTGFTYTCDSQPVVVTINNSTGDDSCSDGDDDNENVRDSVESVTGSNLGDTITGSCFANTFAGDTGSTNNGVGGNDTLNGDPASGCSPNGTDFLGGGEGNDIFNGDGSGTAGFDTVTYGFPFTGHVTSTSANCTVATVNYAVRVTFDDVANDCDGFGNTTDNVNGDIERLIGSPIADNIDAFAADQAVSLFGRAGSDVLTDSTFGDFLNGEGDPDTINCTNGGTDTNVPGAGDTVNGTCEF